MRKLLLPLPIVLALLALPAAAGARPAAAPDRDLPAERDRSLGLRPDARSPGSHSVRLPLIWAAVQSENPTVAEPDWSGLRPCRRARRRTADPGLPVRLRAARAGSLRSPTVLPVASAWQRWGWSTFLRDAVERYGPEGSFWEENPDLPFLPIRSWEIWNEENIVTFAQPRPGRLRRADSALRPGPAPRRPRLEGDRRRPLRTAAADAAQRPVRRLPRAALPGAPGEAVLRRRRAASLCRPRRRDARRDRQPAPGHARPPRLARRRST